MTEDEALAVCPCEICVTRRIYDGVIANLAAIMADRMERVSQSLASPDVNTQNMARAQMRLLAELGKEFDTIMSGVKGWP